MSERDLDLLESLWTLPPAARALPVPSAGGQIERLADRPAGVPVLTGLQRQGDLLVVPLGLLPGDVRTRVDQLPTSGLRQLTATPVTVLASEHAHQLSGRAATWAAVAAGGRGQVVVGVLTVGAGVLEDAGFLERTGGLEEAVALLTHTGHHGALAIGPGRYLLRRQRAADPRPAPVGATAHPPTQTARRPAAWHPHTD